MAQTVTEHKLREWMQKMGPSLIHLSCQICRDRHRAEDIVQRAFVKLWTSPPDAGEPAYSSWLRTVVRNMSINEIRPPRPGELPDTFHDHRRPTQSARHDQSEQRESLEIVRAALDRLDDDKRLILVLRGLEELSYQEIAEALQLPIGTVMSRLNRARRALAEELSRDADPQSYEFRKYLTA